MPNKLQQYFPMIRTREEILAEINSNRKLYHRFSGWTAEQRTEFLDFCTGVKGVKILYDSFSKEILNPESTPERLEDLLSLLLQKEVRILYTLPNDSTRIADENTLLITDIVVELEDGSIANIEVQKIGYKFPGERSACYSADMLLRQYKRVRKKNFSYDDMKSVYTIVLFETSPAIFHEFPDTCIHSFRQQSNSGLELELLQKYIFLPLDIYKKSRHNKPIQNRLEAWLAFFSEDNPERIAELIGSYPEFKFMYEDIYRICRNTEEIMGIFSEELRILDRNTVQLMIDEMQDELDAQRLKYALQKDELNEVNAQFSAQADELSKVNAMLNAQADELSEVNAKLSAQADELSNANAMLSAQADELSNANAMLSAQADELSQKEAQLQDALRRIAELENQ